jgi:hypothetical protein
MEDLLKGNIYLVEEERLELAIQMFLEAVGDRRGLIITRYPIENLEEFDILSRYPNYRLSLDRVRENNLSPHNIAALNQVITDFLGHRKTGIILLEGLEYLVTQNNYQSILRFMQYIYDKVAVSRSVMMLSLNPLAFDLRDIRMLKREAIRPPNALIESIRGSLRVGASKIGP